MLPFQNNMRLTIIIPTLNEEVNLGATLEALAACSGEKNGGIEVIIADAGSSDATTAIAGKFACRVLANLDRGRAKQLNTAAKTATGDALLFLHADTIIGRENIANLLLTLEKHAEIIGGGFYRNFDSTSLLLRFTCWIAGLRGKYWRIFLGDQGIFVRKEKFEQLGRFDETLPYGEDLDFSVRMRKAGKTKIIGPPIISSARRFKKNGPLRQTWIDLKLAIRLTKGEGE